MEESLNILLVDDSPDDRALVIRQLSREFPEPRFCNVSDFAQLTQALQNGPWDLAVTDNELRWTDGLTILTAVKRRWPDCAVIMFAASGNEELAVQAMRAGLDDYVLKLPKHYPRLAAAAHLSLERAKQRRRLRETETRYRGLFDRVPLGVFCVGSDGRIIEANLALVEMLGYPDRRTLLDANAKDLCVGTRRQTQWLFAIPADRPVQKLELQLRRQDGKLIWVEVNARVRDDGPGLRFCEGTAEDISARKRAETRQRDSCEELRALAAHLQSLREEERTCLAREVQSGLGAALAGLRTDLALLRKTIGTGRTNASSLASGVETLKSLPATVDAIMATVRKIVAELRPAVLDELGLEAALKWQIREFQEQSGIKCEFHYQLPTAKPDPEQATAVFRILQETLTNIVRRGRATRATVHLKEEADKLVLEIGSNDRRPNGSNSSGPRSLDLLVVRERATMVDGKISVVRHNGGGTLVGVEIPYRRLLRPSKVTAHN